MQLTRLHQHWDNIILVDNCSTYEPMVEFLKESGLRTIYLKENIGHLAPWASGLVPTGEYYAVTDPDIIPRTECPDDFVEYFTDLAGHHQVNKVGFGLEINDLPECYKYRNAVIEWETRFWQCQEIPGPKSPLYMAPLDTTFAVYRPGMLTGISPAIRTGYPYVAHHAPWYSDSANPTEEERYYSAHANRAVASWLHDDISPVLKNILGVE